MNKTADSSEDGDIELKFKINRAYETAKGFVMRSYLTSYVFNLCHVAENQYETLNNQFKNKMLSAEQYHKKISRLSYCLSLVYNLLGFVTHDMAKKKLLIESNDQDQPLQAEIKLLLAACDDY